MRKRSRQIAQVSLALMVMPCLVTALSGCGATLRRAVEESRVEQLKRDIGKVKFAISTTKTLIARERGATYLPDLYMRLAELFVEEARYHYHMAYEKQKEKSLGVVSVQARLMKNQAIATYKRLLALFPDYRESDKVLFFMAHEMRELGDYENMLKTYLELSDRHPRSEYRLEGLLVVGDYYFDKAELDQAEKYYQMVLDGPESRVHAMAAYKLAWCKINRADFKGALTLFERSVAVAGRWHARAGGKSRSGSDRIDLRREALVDSVFCYTEVRKAEGALKYYRERASSKTTYLAALEKLGNRYFIKQNWKPTAEVYREILSLTGDSEDSLEYAHRLYEAVTHGKLYEHTAADAEALVGVIRRRNFNHALSAAERTRLLDVFEKYVRDIATKLHDLANAKKDEEKFADAVRAYKAYLGFFGKSKQAALVQANLAEAAYAAKQYLEAGRQYERVAAVQRGKERNDSYYTAVVSYFEALGGSQKLSRLDVVEARAGLRRAGQRFIELQPRDPKVVQVKFNVARTCYDEGEFDEAIRYFTALVQQYPTAKEATVSAHLVLDSYRNVEDFEGLTVAGRAFAAMSNLGDSEFKSEVVQIVKGAEARILDTETMRAVGDEEGEGVDRLLDFAKKHAGSEIGEKALLNAFLAARDVADTDKIFEVGERLTRAYPSSDSVTEVLSTMGKVALTSLQLERGVGYLEVASRRKSGEEAAELLKAAAHIRVGLGHRVKAEQALNLLFRSGGGAADKAELAVKVAHLHRQTGDWNAVIATLQRAMAAGASSTEILYLLGYAHFRQNKLAEAQAYLGQAAAAGGSADEDREAAAAAQFYLAEITFKAFETIQLSPDLSQLGPTLQQKVAAMTQTRSAYKAVVKLGSAIWSVAALGRLASVDKAAAESLRGLVLPDGLPPEVVNQVRAALEANAAPLAKESQDALKQCAATARKLKVLSEAARFCLAGNIPPADPQERAGAGAVTRARPAGAEKLERHLAKKPNDVAAITRLGELYLAAGNPYMARLVLTKGLEVRDSASLLNLLGVAAGHLGEHQEALVLFDRALKKEPALKFARANKAALLGQFGYTAESQAELSRVDGLADLAEADPRLLPAVQRLGGGAR